VVVDLVEVEENGVSKETNRVALGGVGEDAELGEVPEWGINLKRLFQAQHSFSGDLVDVVGPNPDLEASCLLFQTADVVDGVQDHARPEQRRHRRPVPSTPRHAFKADSCAKGKLLRSRLAETRPLRNGERDVTNLQHTWHSKNQ
jgi:hypothetical protein